MRTIPLLDSHSNLRAVLSERGNTHLEGNLSFNVGDDAKRVLKARATLAERIGVNPSDIVIPRLTHSVNVLHVTQDHRGMGSSALSVLEGYDAMITNTKNLPLLMIVADCAPILLYDPTNHAVGVVHSGWKGTYDNIVSNTIHEMVKAFGTNPGDLYAVIGPTISPQEYHIDDESANRWRSHALFDRQFLLESSQGIGLHLTYILEKQLESVGVEHTNITQMNLCTATHNDRFFSYRKEQGKTGRFGILAMLV